jgi:hypothetical protein
METVPRLATLSSIATRFRFALSTARPVQRGPQQSPAPSDS